MIRFHLLRKSNQNNLYLCTIKTRSLTLYSESIYDFCKRLRTDVQQYPAVCTYLRMGKRKQNKSNLHAIRIQIPVLRIVQPPLPQLVCLSFRQNADQASPHKTFMDGVSVTPTCSSNMKARYAACLSSKRK